MTEEIKNEAAEAAAEVAPKRKRKAPIVIGIIVVVLVVCGIGFGVWHEQPSFCNAICHTPMDAYGKTYDGSQDFQGNELDKKESMTMLAYTHSQMKNQVTCMGCHVPTLEEQISEGLAWASGNYYTVGKNSKGDTLLENRTLADLTEARGVAENSFCANDTCHSQYQDRAALIAATEKLGTYNPHLERHGAVDCSTCHKAHSQSVNICTECHASAPVPSGWLTAAEAQEKGVIDTINE